ncbi:hypothetical protein NUU61_009110 [Penicillium alfredii]|uniref:Erythromycin esterase n=1 Tax=Penicillium alfredii TaxID=1506179 RepID=A0A9W9EMH8_9EURO|nr:uncharacterized protein NUU61_009110 [Penicillium alfredii]KAJ5084531.1 hypothetical protein NUU61_009110 [Penicillium alfredii]
MAVRRSARLRSSQTPEFQEPTPQSDIASRLPSVVEGDEILEEQHHVQTPVTKTPSHRTPNAFSQQKSATARTPTSNYATRPPMEEMHPSKAHPSTAKQADSGLILGFNPIKKDSAGNLIKDCMFGQESQLSDEARKLMDSVREDVVRIRSQMVQDKSKQEKKDQDAEKQAPGGRKIAKPKGKAGRFSDVHIAEFKKMDSIAGHASSFRGTPGRFQPVNKSLKRTKSKAQLDEPESQNSSPSRSAPKPSTVSSTPAATAKRVKHAPTDDTSTRRPPTETKETSRKPAGPRARPSIRSSLMTPTRASAARSASVKAPKTSLIPSITHSPAAKAVASPRTPRTDFNPRLKGHLPTLGNLKSILRRHQPLFSRDPSKIAAGTHVAAPDFNPDSLLSTAADLTDSAPTPSPKKHVEFTPSVKSRHELAQASPSPSKIPTAPPHSIVSNVTYPTLPALTPEKSSTVTTVNAYHSKSPSIRHVRKSDACEQPATYPELPVVAHGIAHGIGNKKRHRDEVDDDDVPDAENAENVPPADAQVDERGAKRHKANPPTPSPVKTRPVNTPVRSASGRLGTPASKQKSRSVLSLSRLNMLAKPKRAGA